MSIFGWIGLGILFYFILSNHDKKMNENFRNFLSRIENLEYKIQEMEIANNLKDKYADGLEKQVIDLKRRVFEVEKPYQRGILDDLD